jgi:hypothetical protein
LKAFRKVNPSFPTDIVKLIIEYLHIYKLTDTIIENLKDKELQARLRHEPEACTKILFNRYGDTYESFLKEVFCYSTVPNELEVKISLNIEIEEFLLSHYILEKGYTMTPYTFKNFKAFKNSVGKISESDFDIPIRRGYKAESQHSRRYGYYTTTIPELIEYIVIDSI